VGAVALDASIAIGFLDPADTHHERAVSSLRELDQATLMMSASAYSETLVRPLETGHADRVEQFVNGLQIAIVPFDRRIAQRAAELRAEHGALRLPDAVVLATARLCEAALLTFDERLSRLASAAS
jgi:predicted nucleic acid-binding protein